MWVQKDSHSRFDRIAGLLIVVPAAIMTAGNIAAANPVGIGMGAVLLLLGMASMAGVRVAWIFVALMAGLCLYTATQLEAPTEEAAARNVAIKALMMFVVVPGVWFFLRGFGIIKPAVREPARLEVAGPEREES